MSESTSPEQQPQLSRARYAKLKLAGLLSILGLGAVGGAAVGYDLIGVKAGVDSDRSKRYAQVDRDVRCARAVQRLSQPGSGVATVHISRLNNKEQTACGVDWVYTAINDSVQNNNTLHGKIVSTKVRLPSLASLQTDERQQRAAAIATEDPGAKVAGAVLGGAFGLMGTIMVLDSVMSTRRRYNHGALPPDETT